MFAKYDAVFKGRTFDIEREVHLPEGQCYVTIFGQRGRHGWIIRDRDNGERFIVGWKILWLIHDRYLGVTLPEVRRRAAIFEKRTNRYKRKRAE